MTDAGRPHKIAIVGAGAVGATIAYACMIRGVGKQIALYDVQPPEGGGRGAGPGPRDAVRRRWRRSRGPTTWPFARMPTWSSSRPAPSRSPGRRGWNWRRANVAILPPLIPELVRLAPDAVLLLVTNPVDVMTYAALKLSGLPARRVMGSGTVLDSSRFRYLIARRCNVAVQNVHAFIAGEHGDSEVPLWSSASIANIPLHEWAVMGHGKLTVRDRTEIFQNVKQSAYQIIEGKGATNYAIGLATAKILEAVLHNENRVLPVSSLMKEYKAKPATRGPAAGGSTAGRSADEEEAGIDDVCLSVPSLVDRGGVDAVLDVPMNPAEWAGLKNSAETIKAAVRSLGF